MAYSVNTISRKKSALPNRRKRVGFMNPRSFMPAWMLVVLVAVSPSHTVLSQYTNYSTFTPTNPQPVSSYGGSFSTPAMQSYPFSSTGLGVSSMTSAPSISAVPYHDVYRGMPNPSPQTLPFGGHPSSSFASTNTLLSPPPVGIPSISFTSLPSNLPFGGIPSIPVSNLPSSGPLSGLPLIGAYSNQNFQMTQGFGGLQTNIGFPYSFGNVPGMYPQMTTSPQLGLNSAANPLVNYGSTGVGYLPYSHQLPIVPQTVSVGSNPSYDYLLGFKDGLSASFSKFTPPQSFGGSSQNFGTQQPYSIAGASTNTICDYTKQNCHPTYPSSTGYNPFTLQSSTGVLGGTQASFKQSVNFTPSNPRAFQYPTGVLGGLETLLPYRGYNASPNMHPLLAAGQNPWSYQQQTYPTSMGHILSYPYDQGRTGQPVPYAGYSHGYNPSISTQMTTGPHGTTEVIKILPALGQGYAV